MRADKQAAPLVKVQDLTIPVACKYCCLEGNIATMLLLPAVSCCEGR